MRHYRAPAWTLLTLLVILPVVALAIGPEPGGLLRYSSTKTIKGLDPITSNAVASTRLSSLLFDGLVELDPLGTDVVPKLAESFEVGPQIVTFHLRKNVKWHDDHPLTARDVEFTYDVIMNPETETALRDEFRFVAGVSVADEHTISFTLGYAVHNPIRRFIALKVIPRHRFSVLDPIPTPGYGQVYGFIGAGFSFCGKLYACLSTYAHQSRLDPKTGKIIIPDGPLSVDGRPYRFMERMLVFDPATCQFDYLVAQPQPDGVPLLCYSWTDGERFAVTGIVIPFNEDGEPGEQLGPWLVLQNTPTTHDS